MTEKPKEKKQKKKPSKKNYKQHINLIVIIINVILVIVNILVLYLIPDRVRAIIQTRSEILAQQLQNQSAQKLISDLQATEQEKQILNSALPTKSSLLRIIELFESLNSITKVQNFNFESETPKQDQRGYNYLPISLVLEGSLSQTMTALQALKQSPYLFLPKNTLIESPGGLGQSITVRTTLHLYVRQPFKEN